MRILEQLWYGNIHPCEEFLSRDSEYHLALCRFDKEAEKLLLGFSPEAQYDLELLLDKLMDLQTLAQRDAFIAGFRMAVQLFSDASFS